MENIIYFITYSLTLILGYILGSMNSKGKTPQDIIKQAKELLRKNEVGPVTRPTAETLAKRGTLLEQEEKEMEALLSKTIKL